MSKIQIIFKQENKKMYSIINKLVIHRTLLIKRIMQIFVNWITFRITLDYISLKLNKRKIYNIYGK